MKRRVITVILTMALCLALLPAVVLADDDVLDGIPLLSSAELKSEAGEMWVEVNLGTPAEVRNIISVLSSFGKKNVYGGFEASVSIDGGAWVNRALTRVGSGDRWNGPFRTGSLGQLPLGAEVLVRVRYYGENNGESVFGAWSDSLSMTVSENAEVKDFKASGWAKEELWEAERQGLIPAELRDENLKLPVTRAEFAAVSIRVYEALSGRTAEPAAVNPFSDTDDSEVLKALGVGVTNGVSATEFAPAQRLNREQAATMLARVYKKVALSGWTLESDSDFASQFRDLFTMPEPFADDDSISSWAKDSVYFMFAKGIINGVGNNTFAPRAVTPEEQLAGYAQATREQAILIAVRMVKNLS